MWQTIFTLLLSGFGLFAFFKYIILIEFRIDANTFKTLYDSCKNESKIMITEEFISEVRYPIIYIAVCFFKDSPWFFLSHSERLMQAGWENKDSVSTISCFRWRYNKMRLFLRKKLKDHTLGIPVELMLPNYTDKIGNLKDMSIPVVDESLWVDFDKEVGEVAEGKRKKSSALFYGPPGNGKSQMVRYLAIKHQLPIMIVTFNPDWNNHDLLLLFAQIPNKCIVLLEDFDNYFDKRKCILGNKNIKFTFDIILNGLDGAYTTYENVVFIMTVNEIDKVDMALRNRPSRFKFTRLFDNPSFTIRQKLIPFDWSEKTEGFNLDQIFRLKEYNEQGKSFEESVKLLEKEVSEEEPVKSFVILQSAFASKIS